MVVSTKLQVPRIRQVTLNYGPCISPRAYDLGMGGLVSRYFHTRFRAVSEEVALKPPRIKPSHPLVLEVSATSKSYNLKP